MTLCYDGNRCFENKYVLVIIIFINFVVKMTHKRIFIERERESRDKFFIRHLVSFFLIMTFNILSSKPRHLDSECQQNLWWSDENYISVVKVTRGEFGVEDPHHHNY